MWTSDELERAGNAEELELATRRSDGTLRSFVTMWDARVDEALFVRSARGPDSTWYRRAVDSGVARMRAGGVERDVTLTPVDSASDIHRRLDDEYHRKYDRYGAQIVDTVVGPAATLVTLRLDPTD